MKYIKPADFVAVREFQAKYKRIEDDITELLTTDGSAATADELNKKLKSALNAAVLYLSRVNAKYTKEELSRAFNEGKGQADEPPKRTVAEVNEILSAQGFRYAKNAFSQNTYIELQQSMQAAGQSLTHRVNGIIKRLAKTGDDSIYNVQQAIVADLQQNGVLTVEYKNGAKQPISSYAAMAARSARIESTNIGSIGRALQAGTDLVIMTEMPQCCQVCGAYQGKVYSISGKDKRFPALFKTVLSRGYALPHPNCRHEFIPYFAEIEDPADVEQMIKQSQIKYDSKGNLVDVRWQKDIQAYADWQAGNRQRNDELHEYERMREYYAVKGIDAPYSTLGAFRRARRAQSDNYQASRKEWATLKTQEKPKKPLTKENEGATLKQTTPTVYDMYSDKVPNVGDEFYYDGQTVKIASLFNHNGIQGVVLENGRIAVLGKASNVAKTPIKSIKDWDFRQDAKHLIEGGYTDDRLQITHAPYGHSGNDLLVKKLLDDNGYSKKPLVMQKKDFDSLSKEDFLIVHRGVKDGNGKTAHQINDEFAKSEDIWVGRGLFGNGTYTSGGRWFAAQYAGGDESGIMTIAIPKTAKIINAKDLDLGIALNGAKRPLNVDIAAWIDAEYLQKGQRHVGLALRSMLNDKTFKAVSLRADVIQVDPEDWLKVMGNPESVKQYAAANGYKLEPHYVILNRGIVIYKGK